MFCKAELKYRPSGGIQERRAGLAAACPRKRAMARTSTPPLPPLVPLAPRAFYARAAAATTLPHVRRAPSWVSVLTSGGSLNASIRYDSRETVAIR